MTLEILYQDEWLVAVNKPSGWLVHRSWLDRDEKSVSTFLLPIVSIGQPLVFC